MFLLVFTYFYDEKEVFSEKLNFRIFKARTKVSSQYLKNG